MKSIRKRGILAVLSYFTYINGWLQVDGDEYIDSPIGK